MTVRSIGVIVAVFLAVVAIAVGGWFGYWALAKAGQSERYNVNTHSQQYQAGLVSQERDRVLAYDTATDEAQKAQIRATFCAAYTQLDPPTPDLADAHIRIC